MSSFFINSLFIFLFFVLVFLLLRQPLILTLFPYTTLFRSLLPAPVARVIAAAEPDHVLPGDHRGALGGPGIRPDLDHDRRRRSEEHTSELQSRGHLVCRLLLEKKKAAIHLIEQGFIVRSVD